MTTVISKQRTQDESSHSPFVQSIHTLSHRAGDLPPGWRPVLHGALVALRAIDCPARAHIRLTSPRIADLSLDVGSTAPDASIDGILRRVRVRTACTCERCGRSGTLRHMDRKIQVMCAECAAPRLLQHWIRTFMQQMTDTVESNAPVTYRYDQLPFQLRPMIPAHAWSMTGGTCKGAPDASVSLFEMLVYQRRFEAVGDALEHMITAEDLE